MKKQPTILTVLFSVQVYSPTTIFLTSNITLVKFIHRGLSPPIAPSVTFFISNSQYQTTMHLNRWEGGCRVHGPPPSNCATPPEEGRERVLLWKRGVVGSKGKGTHNLLEKWRQHPEGLWHVINNFASNGWPLQGKVLLLCLFFSLLFEACTSALWFSFFFFFFFFFPWQAKYWITDLTSSCVPAN